MNVYSFLLSLIRNGKAGAIPAWLALPVLSIILISRSLGRFFLLRRTGRTAWHSFVPGLSEHALYSLAWKGWYGLIYFVLHVTSFLLNMGTAASVPSGIRGFFYVVTLVICWTLSIIMKIKMAISFKTGPGMTYGLIFFEPLFILLLGLGDHVYRGPVLRQDEKLNLRLSPSLRPHRSYMISLHTRRSRIALIAAAVASCCTFYALGLSLSEAYMYRQTDPSYGVFHFFTSISNTLATIGAVFMIPYAIQGIRKRHFTFPRWIGLFQYSGACCLSLTMVFALFVIWPFSGTAKAVGGPNFFLHIVCPLMALVLLFSAEHDERLKAGDTILALVPFFIYSLFYLVNVVLLGPDNGGWEDIYKLATFLPAAFTLPLMYMLAFLVASGLRILYNRLCDYRDEQMKKTWPDDASPVEVKIEVYGLGRYDAAHGDRHDLDLPIDVLTMLASKYSIPLDQLCKAYNKGLIDGLKDRRPSRYDILEPIFGRPIGPDNKDMTGN